MFSRAILISGYKLEFPGVNHSEAIQDLIDYHNTDKIKNLVFCVCREYDSTDPKNYGYYITDNYYILPESGNRIDCDNRLNLLVINHKEVSLNEKILDFIGKSGAQISEFGVFCDYMDVDRGVFYTM
jgi:hypothetical protein